MPVCPIKTNHSKKSSRNVFCAASIYSDVNNSNIEAGMGKDKKKKGKGKEKTAEKTEKKLKSKVLKKTGEVSYMYRAKKLLICHTHRL